MMMMMMMMKKIIIIIIIILTSDTQFTYEFPLHKQTLHRSAEATRAPGL